MMNKLIRLAVFASGNGSNAENIANYFDKKNTARVSLILSNKKDAYVLDRAKKLGIPSFVLKKDAFYHSEEIVQFLQEKKIDFIVLAGFLWMIPENLIKAFPNKIINIHPALLPKFGGKGMYGDEVHKAVINEKEKKSGITIHYVNERYDEGEVIFQATCDVDEMDNPATLAQKIHQLEYEHFPKELEKLILLS